MKMPHPTRRLLNNLRLLPRALLVSLAVAAPIMAISAVRASDSTIIEAPYKKNSGAGFILMVSLQRA